MSRRYPTEAERVEALRRTALERQHRRNARDRDAARARWREAKRAARAEGRIAVQEAARIAVRRARAAGVLVRPAACEGCGSCAPLHAHHPDYAAALAVAWLCSRCHGAAHRRSA